MGAPQSALEPSKILVELHVLVCVSDGGINVIGHIKEAGALLQRSRQRVSGSVVSTSAVRLPNEDGAAGREAEVFIILKVIAKPGGGDQARRNGEVGANVGGAIRGPEAESVREREGGYGRADVKHPRGRISARQHFAALALILIEPGAVQSNVLVDDQVDSCVRVIRLQVLVKIQAAQALGAEVHRTAELGELRIKSREKPETILFDGAAQRKTGQKVLGAVLLRIVLLVCWVDAPKVWTSRIARRATVGAGIVTGVIIWRAIHSRVVVLGEDGAVNIVAAFFHDHVGHTPQSAAMFEIGRAH